MGQREVNLPTGSPEGKLKAHATLLKNLEGPKCKVYANGKHPHCDALKFLDALEQRYSKKAYRRLKEIAENGFPSFEEGTPWIKRLRGYPGLFEITDSSGPRLLLCRCGDEAIVLLGGFMKDGKKTHPVFLDTAAKCMRNHYE